MNAHNATMGMIKSTAAVDDRMTSVGTLNVGLAKHRCRQDDTACQYSQP